MDRESECDIWPPYDSSGCATSANPQLSCSPTSREVDGNPTKEEEMRTFGVDVHKRFLEVSVCEGGRTSRIGRVEMADLEAFADSLAPDVS